VERRLAINEEGSNYLFKISRQNSTKQIFIARLGLVFCTVQRQLLIKICDGENLKKALFSSLCVVSLTA